MDEGTRNLMVRVDAIERRLRFLEERTHEALALPLSRRITAAVFDRRRDAALWRCDCEHCDTERGMSFKDGRRHSAAVTDRRVA